MSKDKPIVHVELDGTDGQGGVYLKVTTHTDPAPKRIKLDQKYPSFTIVDKRRKVFSL